jgi:hypothetical protein
MCVQPSRPWLKLVYLDMFSVVHLSGPIYRVCWLGLVCPSRLAGPGRAGPGWAGPGRADLPGVLAGPGWADPVIRWTSKRVPTNMCNAVPQVVMQLVSGRTTTPPTMSLGEIGPLQDVPTPSPGHTGAPLIRGMTPRTGTLSMSPRSCMCPGPRPGLHTSRPRFITPHDVWCNQGTTRLELCRISACNIIVSPPCAILDRRGRRA